jgi:hypothetical protein
VLLALVAVLVASPGAAEVTRVEVKSRVDVPGYDYEEIRGRVHFAVDPSDPHNRIVVDLSSAPRNAAGRVEFSADFYALRPRAGGNGAAVFDIVNRGGVRVVPVFNHVAGAADRRFGDGFLMTRGFAVVAVGWEFDLGPNGDLLRIDVPRATIGSAPISGLVRTAFTPDRRGATFAVSGLAAHPPVDGGGADRMLAVLEGLSSSPRALATSEWSLAGDVVSFPAGFEPGRTYELAYRSASPPVGGLGFAAVRDVAAWIKRGMDAPIRARYVYAFGQSQSGRFLRDFLYQGFNADEQDQQVFDGVLSHIAGAGRLDLNARWALPTVATARATAFPFSTGAQRDPVSGITEGLLDNARARTTQPKIFHTNSGVEYWSGAGRAAALVHTTPDGSRDSTPAPGERVYFISGTQHTPSAFPPPRGNGQQRLNPTDTAWVLRALLVSMDRWVRDGVAPPASAYPRLDRGTLVEARRLAFPAIPGVRSPVGLTAGPRAANPHHAGGAGAGAPLPFLVPQVDRDGNERAGIPLPEVAVPLATYTGWNFRAAAIGGTDKLYPLLGSYIPFPRTRAERNQRRDPRLSVEERYPTREAYLSKIDSAAAALVRSGYLLADDVAAVTRRAAAHWDLVMAPVATSSR